MQLIILLVVAIVIAFLVRTQLNGEPTQTDAVLQDSAETQLPRLPARPEDYDAFGQDIEGFMQNSADEKLRRMDESTQ